MFIMKSSKERAERHERKAAKHAGQAADEMRAAGAAKRAHMKEVASSAKAKAAVGLDKGKEMAAVPVAAAAPMVGKVSEVVHEEVMPKIHEMLGEAAKATHSLVDTAGDKAHVVSDKVTGKTAAREAAKARRQKVLLGLGLGALLAAVAAMMKRRRESQDPWSRPIEPKPGPIREELTPVAATTPEVTYMAPVDTSVPGFDEADSFGAVAEPSSEEAAAAPYAAASATEESLLESGETVINQPVTADDILGEGSSGMSSSGYGQSQNDDTFTRPAVDSTLADEDDDATRRDEQRY